uniref:Macaca fascicularis brain cDNA, clone: QbsA-10220 n=1 Tax=Macaca fascicularis TaxID=9541 RepID=I7GA77_MACFA|nr:unnamed protein product [Macaca fascicularis]
MVFLGSSLFPFIYILFRIINQPLFFGNKIITDENMYSSSGRNNIFH